MHGVDERCDPAFDFCMPASASLRQLLRKSVDYAGLFPPCNLELQPALANQATYVRSDDEWMLSSFVLPVARFEEAEKHFASFDLKYPLRISALGPRPEGAGVFIFELRKLVETIQSFSTRHAGVAIITQLEMALPPKADATLLAEARRLLAGTDFPTFWESPVGTADQLIDLLAEYNSAEGGRLDGFKLRTGGVTRDAFPTSEQIARVLVAATQSAVPIKFTAGLHHPLRQYRDEVHTKMHGFLNILGAGVLAMEHQWDEKQTTEMLECEEIATFSFGDDSLRWREWSVSREQIQKHRKLVTSFGSCSFDEPREDLRALGLL
jgi:hypothetical protein